MTVKINGPNIGPIPRPVFISFECDGDHGFLPRPILTSDGNEPYPAFHHRAIAAGWIETPERVLCPSCRKLRRR